LKTTVWILGDQLTPAAASLAGMTADRTVVLMIESLGRAGKLAYHKQKLTFLWSAMRHFAMELRALGYTVDYYTAQPAFKPALQQHIETYHPQGFRLMEPAEYSGGRKLPAMLQSMGLHVELVPNNMFVSDRAEFRQWAAGRKTLVMETFYRRMRHRTGLLMDGTKPAGGEWNYDKENRERPAAGHRFPEIPTYAPDAITRDVMELVERVFPDNFGSLTNFWLPVTRRDTRSFFADFLENRLDMFGPYEDAVVTGERALYHSLLSTLLNVGLLEPLELCRQAESRYLAGQARLNSVEGFIRQIIGWREFVYQLYWLHMPGYPDRNHLSATLPLPEFYWSGDTDMACVAEAITMLHRYGGEPPYTATDDYRKFCPDCRGESAGCERVVLAGLCRCF
jgi:deoxyribodipyrimidine photolyase-related protein